MNSHQLDMFAPAKPGASTVVPFPLWRRGKTVRKVACTLARRVTSDGKSAYWNRTVAGLRRELESRDCDAETVKLQLELFRETVSLEMQRQAHRSGREQA